jgi:predicted  nucleic acid-binding Zn-ribbon protein
MKTSLDKKEEVYKIAKYQTKLADAVSKEQQNLYEYKLAQHTKNLSKINNLIGGNNGGAAAVQDNNDDLAQQHNIMKQFGEQKKAVLETLRNVSEKNLESAKQIQENKDKIETTIKEITEKIKETKVEHDKCIKQGSNTTQLNEELGVLKQDLKTAIDAQNEIYAETQKLQDTKPLDFESLSSLVKDLEEVMRDAKDLTNSGKTLEGGKKHRRKRA